MSEKYYQPILGDNEHLLRSSVNSENYRGLARDDENKNPKIPEFREVEIETPEEQLKRLEAEQDLLDARHRIAEEEKSAEVAKLAEIGVSAITDLILWFVTHPQERAAIKAFFVETKNKAVSKKNELVFKLKKHFSAELDPQTAKAAEKSSCEIVYENDKPKYVVIMENGAQVRRLTIVEGSDIAACDPAATISSDTFEAIVSEGEENIRQGYEEKLKHKMKGETANGKIRCADGR